MKEIKYERWHYLYFTTQQNKLRTSKGLKIRIFISITNVVDWYSSVSFVTNSIHQF